LSATPPGGAIWDLARSDSPRLLAARRYFTLDDEETLLRCHASTAKAKILITLAVNLVCATIPSGTRLAVHQCINLKTQHLCRSILNSKQVLGLVRLKE
jgi:hypothetical protein